MINVQKMAIMLNGFKYDPKLLQRSDQTFPEALVSHWYGMNCLGAIGDQDKAIEAWKQSIWDQT